MNQVETLEKWNLKKSDCAMKSSLQSIFDGQRSEVKSEEGRENIRNAFEQNDIFAFEEFEAK